MQSLATFAFVQCRFCRLFINYGFMMKKPMIIILFLWIILTLFNINKAYHIDDTFHLEAAEWIKDHPGQPMSGMVNWADDPTPLYTHNQPPLFFFTIALVSSVAGTHEWYLHLYLSVFTLAALLLFYRITLLLNIRRKLILLVLFASCPALVVNQNLMTDVPVLALLLASVLFVIQAAKADSSRNYFFAGLILGIGLLIKYSVLPLVVAMLLVILLRKHYRYLWTAMIPVSLLIIWSFWNWSEFGSIHFFDRPRGEIHINRFWSFMACMGSVAAFSLVFVRCLFDGRRTGIVAVISLVLLFLAPVPMFLLKLLPEERFSNLLNYLFIINGFLVYIGVFYLLVHDVKKGFRPFIDSPEFVVLLYAGALSLFMVLFAPFMATRHLLLIIPFVLLFGYRFFDNAPKFINTLAISASVILAVALSAADYEYADFYRQMAKVEVNNEGRTIWSRGHWGWQWYSEKAGMRIYSTNHSEVKEGDFMVFPGDVPLQTLNEKIELELLEKLWKPAGYSNLLSVSNFGSMYSSSMKIPPWTFSAKPLDTLYIYRISQVKK